MKINRMRIIKGIFYLFLLCFLWNSQIVAQDQFLIKNNVNSNQQTSNDPMKRTDSEWKRILSQEEYRILREKSTERAFTGEYDGHFEEGMYVCAGCGNDLFESEAEVRAIVQKNGTIENYLRLVQKYKIMSIEDPFGENDWSAWTKLLNKTKNKLQIVGDDLFVTNLERLKIGFLNISANSILIKLNQIGTVTETLEVIKFAKLIGYKTIISHRSGDSEDTFIADFAVGTDSNQIKTGSLARSERVSKYNQLLRIEQELGKKSKMHSLN